MISSPNKFLLPRFKRDKLRILAITWTNNLLPLLQFRQTIATHDGQVSCLCGTIPYPVKPIYQMSKYLNR